MQTLGLGPTRHLLGRIHRQLGELLTEVTAALGDLAEGDAVAHDALDDAAEGLEMAAAIIATHLWPPRLVLEPVRCGE